LKWYISEETSGGSNCTITLSWMSSAEGENFALNRSSYSKIWNCSAGTEAGNGVYTVNSTTEPFSVTTYSVETFSPFVVGKNLDGIVDGIENGGLSVPAVFSLAQNYPNPFNPSTIIEFTVDQTSSASLKVYDMLGREVATVFTGTVNAGIIYRVPFNGSALSSGAYLYKLETCSLKSNELKTIVRKMTLFK